jgi:hypothetical protein
LKPSRCRNDPAWCVFVSTLCLILFRSVASRILTINGRKLTACHCSCGPNLPNCPEARSDIPCPLETQGAFEFETKSRGIGNITLNPVKLFVGYGRAVLPLYPHNIQSCGTISILWSQSCFLWVGSKFRGGPVPFLGIVRRHPPGVDWGIDEGPLTQSRGARIGTPKI